MRSEVTPMRFTVDETEPNGEADLLPFYNPDHAFVPNLSQTGPQVGGSDKFERVNHQLITRATLRLFNDKQEVDFCLRAAGQRCNAPNALLRLRACTKMSSEVSSTYVQPSPPREQATPPSATGRP